MTSPHPLARIAITLAAILLAACGGGGGDPPGTPVISVQPADQTTFAGQDASFSVTATGTALSYQWRHSTDAGANFADLAGATNATLNLTAVPLADNAHRFRVIVSNSAGSVTSASALLTVNAAPVQPVFTVQPASQSVSAPDAATFSVAVTGSPAPTLQWQLSTNGGVSFTNIPGATGTSHITPATVAGDNGNRYRVIATNTANTTTSNVATLTVTVPAAPVFTVHPQDTSVVEGQNAQLTVTVTGTPTPALQWQLSTDSGTTWNDIVGATAGVFNIIGPALANNGRQFRAVADNGVGPAVNSNAATLTVNANIAPVAVDDIATTAMDTALIIAAATLIANDTDANGTPLTLSAVQNPVNGTVILSASNVTFTPTPGFTGSASFEYTVSDGALTDTGLGTVTVTAAARSWRSPVRVSPDQDGDVYDPQIAFSSNGSAVAVWIGSTVCDPSMSIWANRYTPGGGWGTAERIEALDFTAQRPRVALDAAGNAVVVWQQLDRNPIFGVPDLWSVWANRYVSGAGWSGPQLLEIEGDPNAFDYRSADSPRVAVSANGSAFAVWTQGDANGSTASVWGNPGAGATLLETASFSAGNPNVAIDATGDYMAIWTQFDGIDFNVWASYNSGTPVRIETTTGGNPYSLEIAMSAGGDAVAIWENGCSKWANRFSASSGWGIAQLLQNNTLCNSSPQAVIDASGNSIVAWESTFGGYIARYSPGSGWGTPVLQLGPAGNRLAMNGVGSTMHVYRNGASLYANSSPATFPNISGVYEQIPVGDAFDHRLAMDAGGNAMLAYKRAETPGVRNAIWASSFR